MPNYENGKVPETQEGETEPANPLLLGALFKLLALSIGTAIVGVGVGIYAGGCFDAPQLGARVGGAIGFALPSARVLYEMSSQWSTRRNK